MTNAPTTQQAVDPSVAAAEAAAAKKAAAEQKAAEKKAAAEQKKAEREAEKKKKAEEKAAAKAAKEAEKEANKMPEQNGVRRPKPETLCGKVWAEADRLSNALGQATPVRNLIDSMVPQGMNEGNIKAEYARWRKFNGITGRVALPKPKPAPATTSDSSAPAESK